MSTEVLRPEPVAGGSRSGGGKLGVLINKLHEFLAVSTEQGSEHSLPGHWSGAMAQDFVEQQQQAAAQAAKEPSSSSETKPAPAPRSKRKPLVVTKHSGLNESDVSSESETEEVLSINSSEPDTTCLPKGTVFVLPEPVGNEVRDEFRGPEFRSKRVYKQNRDVSDRRKVGYDTERVNCTACGQQVNHFLRDSVYQHPALKVLICKSCFKYYMSDDISKDAEGMDEQCRWCAEGGSLIGCDYCSNAFCKKCVLRNLGRRELSAILEEERKWYCYVCSPEPLMDLVLACDAVLQNLEKIWARKRSNERGNSMGRGMGGGGRGRPRGGRSGMGAVLPVGMAPSQGLCQRMQRVVEMTASLNQSFTAFMQSEKDEEASEEEDVERARRLMMFRTILRDLREAQGELQNALDRELGASKPAGAGSKARGRPRKGAATRGAGITKELVVKLTPVPLRRAPNANANSNVRAATAITKAEAQATRRVKEEKVKRDEVEVRERMDGGVGVKEEVKVEDVDEETADVVLVENSEDEEDESEDLTLAEANKRSPRVKTTPRRRRTDTDVVATHSHLAEDSDSDEVPAVLLQTTAGATSDEEGAADSDGANQEVRKKCLFGLVKTTPPCQDRNSRKRKLKERSSSSSSSSSSSTSASSGSGSKVRRPVVHPHKVPKTTADSESLSSDLGGQEIESGRSSDSEYQDQKIKPLSDVTLLASGTFHQQSSGDEMEAQPSPSLVLEEDDVENRIAKQILLAQIRANLSSESDQESMSDDSEGAESEDEEGLRENNEKEKNENLTDVSEPTDNSSDPDNPTSKPLTRHHLLSCGLAPLEAEAKGHNKDPDNLKRKKTNQDKELIVVSSDGHDSASEESALSEELSQSEDEDKSPKEKNSASDGGAHTPTQQDAPDAAEGGDEDVKDAEDVSGTPKGRRKIRRIMEVGQLAKETQEALREEEERRKRLEERDRQRQQEESREQGKDDEVMIVSERPAPNVTPLVLEQDDATRKALVQVDAHLLSKLKPHQREGVQFMWDSCCESIVKVKESSGSGCILAHCMGLGKTLQVIAFLHTVLSCELVALKTALVVCPLNTVLNWRAEFDKWQSGIKTHKLEVIELVTVKSVLCRVEALSMWHRKGGVMIVSYEIYRILTHGQQAKYAKHQQSLRTALQNPGPDVVICDEGHILRNDATGIFKAMSSIRTRRRIVLTGTPLQNNLSEYHCMVNFVKQNLLGSLREFRNRFINPIQNGQCADSTPSDVRLMKKRVHVLHELLGGCVQRRDYSVLTRFLPPKHEYVLSIRMTPLQCKLYAHYLQNYTGEGDGVNRLFQDFRILSLIWIHPWCLQLSDLNKGYKVRAEDPAPVSTVTTSELSSGQKNSECAAEERRSAANTGGPSEEEVPSMFSGPPVGWYREFVSDADAAILEHSGKLVLLMEILHLAEQLQNKVLVFSQSLVSLDLIEKFLELADKAKREGKESLYKGEKSWLRDKDYYRLDGSTSATERKKWTQEFNNVRNTRGRLFLISTKAGSLGINLVAANRVVLFDASWNPTYDVQSIFRVYRFGQRKPVYVYRFLAQGTMEQKIYERQVAKQSLSSRVVDQQQIQRHFTHSQLSELYRFRPDLHPKTHNSLPSDKVLAVLLQQCGQSIVSFHEHDSLLDHRKEEELSVEERKEAWEEYQAEETAAVQDGGEQSSAAKKTKQEDGGQRGFFSSLWQKSNQELEAMLKKGRLDLQRALQNIESRSPDFFIHEVVSLCV
ncbi:transcriptional regulator ATRX-like isoform X1 [Colossoma macropomum]|uniref:transcriptional regulator ATRX-like isoform X1 n=1 Tax=Colossoma macropomum TaxID=42526 RepID=UPI0018653AAD|nr:transcriptional regulator ATRX-like isoform X1 [Colossoma macropomum]